VLKLLKVIWEERVATPTSENELSHCMLAVACTMRNEGLRKNYGALQDVMGALRNVMDALHIITGRYGMLWNITEHCGTLQNVTEALQIIMGCYGTLQSVAGRYGIRKRYSMLWSIMEHYGALRDVTERYRSATELLWYGMLRTQYGKYQFCPSLLEF